MLALVVERLVVQCLVVVIEGLILKLVDCDWRVSEAESKILNVKNISFIKNVNVKIPWRDDLGKPSVETRSGKNDE